MCKSWDLQCNVNEFIGETAQSWAHSAADLIVKAFSSQMGTLSAGEYGAGLDLAAKLFPIMAIFTVLVALIQIGAGMVALNRASIVKAVIAAIAAPLVTFLGMWLAVSSTNQLDRLSQAMLPDLGKTVEKMIPTGDWADVITAPTPTMPLTIAAGIAGVLWLLSMVLTIILLMRNFAIVALIGFAPLALMVLPSAVTREWGKVWAQTLLALVIAKPVMAGVLNLANGLMSSPTSGTADLLATSLMGIAALVIACAAPAACMALVKFAGSHHGNDMTSGAAGEMGSKGRSASRAMSSMGRSGVSVSRLLVRK